MGEMRDEYQKKLVERKKVLSRLSKLLKDKSVQEYLTLNDQNLKLDLELSELYSPMKEEEFSECEHIWLPIDKISGDCEGRSDIYYGCMKCGLDQRIISATSAKFLSPEYKAMYDYLHEHKAIDKGIMSHTLCDFDLARAMYSKIVEYHPDIDDVTALKYFEIALDDIRNIRVNENRKESRAKRLMLQPGFNHWGGYKN